mgnify:CR=1 FL=1
MFDKRRRSLLSDDSATAAIDAAWFAQALANVSHIPVEYISVDVAAPVAVTSGLQYTVESTLLVALAIEQGNVPDNYQPVDVASRLTNLSVVELQALLHPDMIGFMVTSVNVEQGRQILFSPPSFAPQQPLALQPLTVEQPGPSMDMLQAGAIYGSNAGALVGSFVAALVLPATLVAWLYCRRRSKTATATAKHDATGGAGWASTDAKTATDTGVTLFSMPEIKRRRRSHFELRRRTPRSPRTSYPSSDTESQWMDVATGAVAPCVLADKPTVANTSSSNSPASSEGGKVPCCGDLGAASTRAPGPSPQGEVALHAHGSMGASSSYASSSSPPSEAALHAPYGAVGATSTHASGSSPQSEAALHAYDVNSGGPDCLEPVLNPQRATARSEAAIAQARARARARVAMQPDSDAPSPEDVTSASVGLEFGTAQQSWLAAALGAVEEEEERQGRPVNVQLDWLTVAVFQNQSATSSGAPSPKEEQEDLDAALAAALSPAPAPAPTEALSTTFTSSSPPSLLSTPKKSVSEELSTTLHDPLYL